MNEADMEKHARWKQAADSANSYDSFLWLALSSYDLKGSLTTPLKRHLKAFIAHQKHLNLHYHLKVQICLNFWGTCSEI